MTTIIKINGMSCGHCSMAVKKALGQIEGVETVEVNLEEKTATISSTTSLDINILKEIIDDEGYEFIGIL
ncbi:MAG: heavy-metal-associated domain-containing protein [Fusobacteriaceae bacterium]|jgi:copper chaperone CopZ|nr:heavy-metal-associated domain-containing protein [Fusobacteriaceae bacterium]MBP6467335.1 heavy-metal-associated domain-containing protein [Fusobacteriaceae bacterium]MBP9596454.1 heavy-metal-associated domain-containing protein [Fusobacteriaceae bacterium]MBU9917758.1 cation transporter [Fusobacteriaceae bacterium]